MIGYYIFIFSSFFLIGSGFYLGIKNAQRMLDKEYQTYRREKIEHEKTIKKILRGQK